MPNKAKGTDYAVVRSQVLDGMPMPDIAKAHGVAPATIHSWLQRNARDDAEVREVILDSYNHESIIYKTAYASKYGLPEPEKKYRLPPRNHNNAVKTVTPSRAPTIHQPAQQPVQQLTPSQSSIQIAIESARTLWEELLAQTDKAEQALHSLEESMLLLKSLGRIDDYKFKVQQLEAENNKYRNEALSKAMAVHSQD